MKKRIVAFICVLSLVLSLMPVVPASAASVEVDELTAALLRDNSPVDNAIAVQSIRLSNAIYDSKSKVTTKLSELGFTVLDSDFRECTLGENHVAFTLARKNVQVNGETYYIYSIVVRGTKRTSVPEWLSDLDVGQSADHDGFVFASFDITRSITAHITTPKEKNILWITGHSRGAAVANYIAGLLMSSNNRYVNSDAIHAYTFACPNFTKNPNTTYNIYNFNFEEDLVPQVPLESWGYGRHGKTYQTSVDKWTGSKHLSKADVKSVVQQAKKAIPTSYACASLYFHLISSTGNEFYGIIQEIIDGKYLSASNKMKQIPWQKLADLIYSDGVREINVLDFIVLGADVILKIPKLAPVHESETYMKWIEGAYPTGYDTSAAGDYSICKETAVVCSAPIDEDDNKVVYLPYGTRLTVKYSLINSKGSVWYKLGGDYAGYYIYSENVAKCSTFPDSTLKISVDIQNPDMLKGHTNKLVGVISSNYPLSKISASLNGKSYTSFTTSEKILNIADTTINSALNFKSLKPGNYTIKITASDIFGEATSKTLSFTVSEPKTDMPTLSVSDFIGGKTVYLSGPSGADIYYTTNGDTPTTGSARYPSNGIELTHSATVKAIAVKDGIASGVLTQSITVDWVSPPTIDSIPTPEGSQIVIVADPGAMIYYSTGDGYLPYYAPFTVTQDTEISAYAERAGYITSSTATLFAEVVVPEQPVIVMPVNGTKVAQGSAVTLHWNPISNASSYTVEVKLNGETIDVKTVTDSNATFLLNNAAETALCYTFTVQAHNNIGSGDVSSELVVEAMPPCPVTFVDWDGTVLSEQLVTYGSAAVAPQDPSRRGHYFRYWDRDFAVVTSELVVNPVYQIITYTVTFLDSNGTKLSVQNIPYSGAVNAPVDQVTLPTGYIFLGWSINAEAADSLCDLTQIDSNMTAKAIIGWEDAELPLHAQIESAQRNDDKENGNYEITVRLTNSPEQYTTALLRVSLKTAEGKMVKTESRTVGIEAGANELYTFMLNYSGTATKAEVVVLGYDGDYLTGSAYSKAVSADITVISDYVYGEWSGWSTTMPDTQSDREIETKTQYRYQTKATTSSSNQSMDGWTLYDQTSYWGEWSAWSDWSTSEVTASDSVEVQSKTEYRYYRYYCDKNHAHSWYGGTKCKAIYPSCTGTIYLKTLTFLWCDVSYETAKTWSIATADGQVRRDKMGGNIWWYYYPNLYSSYHGTRTVYSYRTRPLYTTYHFYKWSDWSAWQDTMVSASDTQNVETQTLYRYRDKNIPVHENISGIEDTTGEFYTFAGTVTVDGSVDLSGKQATVMVYKGKNSDPNESQLQYVGQITIGEGNAYDITFKTKDVPTATMGDYVVCLSLQGSTGLVNIGVIEAPSETYVVNFYNGDGQLIDSQVVEEGKNAVAPEVPEKEGYNFIAWSDSGTNVHGDMDITAIYVPKTYAVVFVDWVNGSAIPMACEYGTSLEEIAATIIPAAEGHVFVGWDQLMDGQTTVTENMVVSAVFEPETYTVTFYDSVGEDKIAVSTQIVSYGQSAVLPEAPSYADREFLGWSTDESWWNVRCDMDVYPITTYSANASIPMCSFEQDIENNTTWLVLSAVDGAVIYYTLDGSIPVPGENGIEYTSPVELIGGELVRAISVEPGKNNSEVVDAYLDYSVGNSYSGVDEIVEVGTYTPIVNPGDEVIVNVGITENPGLMSYYFIIECDPTVYYIDCVGDSGEYNCVEGDVINTGTMLVAPVPGVGWRVLWFDTAVAEGDGTLFTLTLKVSSDAVPGTHQITVSYSSANMLGEDYVETSAKVEGSVTGSAMRGDVNGDGSLTLADVIRIARHIIGLDIITDIRTLLAADVNGDGVVTTADVVKLARFIAGLETLLVQPDSDDMDG